MAEQTNRGMRPLYLIIGGLVVAVGVGAFILYGGNGESMPASTTTTSGQSTTQPTTDGGATTNTTTE